MHIYTKKTRSWNIPISYVTWGQNDILVIFTIVLRINEIENCKQYKECSVIYFYRTLG